MYLFRGKHSYGALRPWNAQSGPEAGVIIHRVELLILNKVEVEVSATIRRKLLASLT